MVSGRVVAASVPAVHRIVFGGGGGWFDAFLIATSVVEVVSQASWVVFIGDGAVWVPLG